MQKVRFSSDDLPAELDDRGRLEAWKKFYGQFYTSLEMDRVEDRPFAVHFAAAHVGRYRLGRIAGSLAEVRRTATQIADAQNNDFVFALNTASARLFYSQAGRSVTLDPGSAVLTTNAEPGVVRGAQFRDVVKEIKAGFLQPEFSPDDVCKKLNLSPRYLQALLAESGESFTERVNELRLQKARGLLERAGSRHMKISDIAYQ